MSSIGLIQDIPKGFTALAEWLACVLYIAVINRTVRITRKHISVLAVTFALLFVIQSAIGKVAVVLWIPGMLVAVLVMYAAIMLCCKIDRITAGYWLVRAFVLAEMVAALEWQVFSFTAEVWKLDSVQFRLVLMIVMYALTFGGVFVIENRQKYILGNMTTKELLTSAAIGVVCFCLSNLSYVYTNTPFSSPLAKEAFNIRTLIDLGGYAFLLAYHIQRCEDHVKAELDSIQNILRTQYSQYRQSQESIDIINHKYHDLKHQIAILRQEKNLDKKEEYLDEIEQGIQNYESMFKTGNNVLDTLITGAGLKCSRRDIAFTCVADGTLLNQIYVMDLCTIFGNALDNAIEYEVQVEDREKRLIHVSVSRMNEFALIHVENYLQDTLEFHGNLPKSTKGDKTYHGFGLKSIKYSVEKYQGTLNVKIKDNWFVIDILIPLQKNESKE